MKKVIYSLSIALVATFTSCGEAKSKEGSKDIKEELELAKEEVTSKREAMEEDVLEEGVVMVNGLQFFGNNEFEMSRIGHRLTRCMLLLWKLVTFEGLVKAEISEVCKKAGMLDYGIKRGW